MTKVPEPERLPLSVMILSTLFYGVFAIVAVSTAFAFFWPAGVALAAFVIWRGIGPMGVSRIPDPAQLIGELRIEAGGGPSGNLTFDRYRSQTLQQLEGEQEDFGRFVSRLREARDRTEFDAFLDERAERIRQPKAREPDWSSPVEAHPA